MNRLACRDDTEGNKIYTGTEYDNLTGYIEREYSMEWTDRDGTRWMKRCVVVNLGRPDRGVVVDPDAAMLPESLDHRGLNPRSAKAVEENKRLRAERDIAMVDDIRAVLQEHGPMTAIKIARRLGTRNSARALRVLRANPDVFICHEGHVWTWSLVGQLFTLSKVRKPSPMMIAMRDALAEHGPQTAIELAERLGVDRTSAPRCLASNPEWFQVVTMREGAGVVPSRVWGLR